MPGVAAGVFSDASAAAGCTTFGVEPLQGVVQFVEVRLMQKQLATEGRRSLFRSHYGCPPCEVLGFAVQQGMYALFRGCNWRGAFCGRQF